MDCSLPGSSVHEIFQARILECGPTFKEQAELDGSGEELRTPETLTDLRLQNSPTRRPQETRGGVSYPSNKEKETHRAKTLRGVRAFQLSHCQSLRPHGKVL